MDHTQREIRNEIEATRAGMVQKIATLEHRVDGKIREVKRSFDVNYQTEQRPWLMVGIAAFAGYLLSGILLGRPAPRARLEMPKDWQPRLTGAEQQQKAGIATSLMGMLSGVVTATAVSLAREYASKMIFKQQQGTTPQEELAGQPAQDRRFQ